MFLNKIGIYRKFLLAQRDLNLVSFLTTKIKYDRALIKSSCTRNYPSVKANIPTFIRSCNPQQCTYSTSTKPQMTFGMQRWKQKKRKSKSQQKREIEQLQEDLVKILTKRAIQLVKNKSLENGRREIILTHAFTHLTSGSECEGLLSSYISLEAGDFVPESKFINKSDFIAHHVEAHFKSPQKQDLEQLPHFSTAFQVLERPENMPTRGILANMSKVSSSWGETLSDTSPPQAAHIPVNKVESKPSRLSNIIYSFSDLFSENLNSSHQLLPASKSADFNSDLKNFVSELKTVLHRQYGESGQKSIEANEALNIPKDDVKTKQSVLDSLLQQHSNNLETKKPNKSKTSIVRHSSTASSLEVPSLTLGSFIPPSFITSENTQYSVDAMYDSLEVSGVDENVHLPVFDDMSKPQIAAQHEAHQFDPVIVPKRQKRQENAFSINVSNELQGLIEKSFVDACCLSDNALLAVRNLQYLALKQKITSVDVFNRLIHALAKKHDLKTVKNLFSLIKKQGLKPNLQTYAACLECFGRMPKFDAPQVQKLIADAKNKGLDLCDIANTCSYEADEFQYVLKAIQIVEPDFKPNPPNYEMKYSHKLVSPLNDPNKKALEKNPYAIDFCKTEMLLRANTQLEMESKGEVIVNSIYKGGKMSSNAKLKSAQKKVLEDWKKVLQSTFTERVANLEKKAKDNGKMTLYPYLKLLPPDDYINIIFSCLRELFSSTEGYSPAQSTIKNMLGQAVNRKYNILSKTTTAMDEKVMRVYKRYIDSYLDKDFTLDNHRCMWLREMGKDFDTVNMDLTHRKWPHQVHKEIGNFLLEMIIYDLKINSNLLRPNLPERLVPAFSTIFRPDISMMCSSEIKLHPVVARLFKVDSIEAFTFDPSIVPMLVPPVPWVSKSIGGLMLGSPTLIRVGIDMQHLDCLKNVKASNFPAVLDSLNTLSACAWKINKPILDLQIQIFNDNGNSLLKISPPAAELPPLPTVTKDMALKDKALVYRQRIQLQQQKQDVHGLWCADLYRLSIANKYRDETFWFPHSLDFRGRTYPLPPHFNHLGSDNVRGMLHFAKGKPLGEKGYDWLKIHLVNLTGFKKRCSNQERLDFANSMMDSILDSANNPLNGQKWWQQADEPWQALACCMEIANIEKFSGKKEDYICHFPVHQDGSCNGLQHYAALGRDQAGAESVNLYPFDSPKDVYSDVVELVEKARKRDADNGNEIAKVLEGFVKRKVIKQTVMTTVYGVTRFGAKAQIHKQLKDIKDFPTEHAWPASLYLTHTTFTCLREMFTATKDIQDWLTESARQISSFAPVDWVTPLGFPVLQPYYKKLTKGEIKDDKFKPNAMKQKNAFPPNFIHSLDSTHMMLTSLYCMHAGTTFVSVHDCYWTHACDVPIMNKICRDQFVNMHKEPLLEDLSEHLIEQVKAFTQLPYMKEKLKEKSVTSLLKLLSNIPKRGTFELDNVLKSTYFFS